VQRLRLLAAATSAGEQIGLVAGLGVDDLQRLCTALCPDSETKSVRERALNQDRRSGVGRIARPGRSAGKGRESTALTRDAVLAILEFNGEQLQRVLEQGAVRFGHHGVLHQLVAPLVCEVGGCWQIGQLTTAHEHFATAAVREFLAWIARPYALEEGAPSAVIATPSGQLHELGALMAAAAAGNLGWRTVYLGASLPPAEIAGAVLTNHAAAVLLSVVYPSDDSRLPAELRQLRRLLPLGTHLLVGGRGASGYRAVLQEIGAETPGTLADLQQRLEVIRRERTPGARASSRDD
jgi:methanogenic corrinoid protein MtbC1